MMITYNMTRSLAGEVEYVMKWDYIVVALT